MEEKTSKPRFGMWSCLGFMSGLAWRIQEKKVVFIVIGEAFTEVLINLVNLCAVPAVLAVIGGGGSLGQLIAVIAAFVLPMMLLAGVKEYLEQNHLYGRVTVRTTLIGMLNEKICRTSYPNLTEKRFQDLSTKAMYSCSGNSEATEAIWVTAGKLLTAVLGFAVYMAMLTAAEPILLGLVLVTSVTGYFVSKRLNSYGYRHREEEAAITKQINYQLEAVTKLEIAKDLRIFGMRPWINEVTEKALAAMKAFHRRAENVYIWGRVVDLVLALLRNGVAYWFLIAQVLAGSMSVPAFLLYFSAVGGFTQWVTEILGNLNTLHRQGLEISVVREVLDYPEIFRIEGGSPLAVDPSAPHQICLEDVSYTYPGSESPVISHINLTIHPGEKLAIVGLNGAGKTTLIKLICGFLDPDSGRVLLDGEDIRQYNRPDYYSAFATVFQDFSLLAASIGENVAQSRNVDRKRVEGCLEKAGLRERIASLPQGMDTKLVREVYSNGVELSGGETQRLMLARCLYKDAAFLLLDEPTAALDPIAEADMYSKYNEMTQGRLSVYISHRLASTQFCHRILFIEDGKIAEEGSHQELLAKGGGYAKLFEIQSKYYQEDYEGEEQEL